MYVYNLRRILDFAIAREDALRYARALIKHNNIMSIRTYVYIFMCQEHVGNQSQSFVLVCNHIVMCESDNIAKLF